MAFRDSIPFAARMAYRTNVLKASAVFLAPRHRINSDSYYLFGVAAPYPGRPAGSGGTALGDRPNSNRVTVTIFSARRGDIQARENLPTGLTKFA
jgi:hypothetical protein